MHVKRSVFWPLYGFIVQYSWRDDRKQDGRDEERHAAKGNKLGLETWAGTKPLQMEQSLWVPEADLRWENRENMPHTSIHFPINRLNNETVSDRVDVRQHSERLDSSRGYHGLTLHVACENTNSCGRAVSFRQFTAVQSWASGLERLSTPPNWGCADRWLR